MAVDFYLKLDGIAGEATAANFKDWIQVNTFGWKETNQSSGTATGGSGAGKVNFVDLKITKTIDSSTVNIFNSCAGGKHIKTATLSLVKAGANGQAYFKIDLTEVFVTSHEIAGPSSEIAIETLTLGYKSIRFSYFVQGATGTVTAQGVGGWSLVKNAAT